MNLAAFCLALFAALFVVSERIYARWRLNRVIAKHCTSVKTGSAAVVRHASLYVGARKIGTMVAHNYRIYGDSAGTITTSLSADTIITVDPSRSYDFADDLLNGRDIDVIVSAIAGKKHAIRMRVTEADFRSDAKTGMLNGKFHFVGGKPNVEAA